jgi:hypothetical protein
LRALLFAAGGAGIGFSLHERTGGGSKYHVLAAALFVVAIVMVYWSWDLQKRKARQRFELVRDTGVSAYLAWEKGEQNESAWQKYKSNRRLDWIAVATLAVAVVFEGLLAFLCP